MNGSIVLLLLLLTFLDFLRSEELVSDDDAILKEFVANLYDFLRKAGSDDYWKFNLPSCSDVDRIRFRIEHLNSITDMADELMHLIGQPHEENNIGAVWQRTDDVLRLLDGAVSALDRLVINKTAKYYCYSSRDFLDNVYVPLASQAVTTLCVVLAQRSWRICRALGGFDEDRCSLERVEGTVNCSLVIVSHVESQSDQEGPKNRQNLRAAAGSVASRQILVQRLLEQTENITTLTEDLRVAVDYYLDGVEFLASNYRKVMHPKGFRHHKKRSSWQLVKRYSVRHLDGRGRSVQAMNGWFSGYRQFLSSIIGPYPDATLSNNTTAEIPVWTDEEIFVDSPCLCHLAHYDFCNTVWTASSDDSAITELCVAVLLENLRSSSTVRLVISFLDYSLAKKVSRCALKDFLVSSVKDEFCIDVAIDPIRLGKNWSVPIFDNRDDKAFLCMALELLSNHVDCTSVDPSNEQHLAFYIYRHAVLQIAFVVVDVLTRIISLVVYVSISELRNLPGKCFIAFQLTALLNCLFVRYLLPECKIISLHILVYLENFLTLSSSFWLNAFCAYLYHCFATMTLPNSLCPRKARKIFFKLFSYATLLPAVFTLICMATDFTNGAVGVGSSYSAYEYGKIAFFAANLAALLSNLIMYGVFVVKINRVRIEVEKVVLRNNPNLQEKFTKLLHFTTKVFVLSSLGFLVRTLLYQMEDIDHWINVVYLGRLLEGPLFFKMFICNKETKKLVFNKVYNVPSGKTSRFYVKCDFVETLNVRTSNRVTYRHSGLTVLHSERKRDTVEKEEG